MAARIIASEREAMLRGRTVAASLEELLEHGPRVSRTTDRERAPEGTPLYVHLPFCAAKCHYCDFFSVPADGQDRGATIAAILREAELRAPWRPHTVFLGGGTPSLFSCDELRRLFDGLHSITSFRDSAVEVTAECNPESLDEDKARCFLDLGVQRLSIGFQSLSNDVLKLFGRVHSVEQSFAAFAAARAAGVANLNIDMIFAVPGQTAEQWSADLARVLALGSEHLSAYNLTFEEETLFKRWLDQGRIARQPEELELELFHLTRELARARGLEPYEISNFSRSGRQCLHNLNYWRNEPYLGIGPSAVSKVGHTRAGNVKAIQAYNRRIEAAGDARAWEETPDPVSRLAETWWLGLRTSEGVEPGEARARAGFETEVDPALVIAMKMVEADLLVESRGRYRLSERGIPLADFVAKKFLLGVRA